MTIDDKTLREMGFERGGDFEIDEFGDSHRYFYDDIYCIDKDRLIAGIQGARFILKSMDLKGCFFDTLDLNGNEKVSLDEQANAIQNFKKFLGEE